MKSILDKFKRGLTKTRDGIFGEISTLLNSKFIIDDALLEQLEERLITADIGVDTSVEIIETLKEHVTKRGFKESAELVSVVKEKLAGHLAASSCAEQTCKPFSVTAKPFVILVVGVNGTGKTTTVAKLAKLYHESGKKVLLAAADTFRAAASEQLEIWAKRTNVDIVKTQPGGDPAAVAYDALNAAKARDVDVVLVDTAGRLHNKAHLMEELRKIYRVLGNAIPGSPHEVLLVLDATTGQNAITQARQFKQTVNVSGVVITKLDGTAKGGMVIAVHDQLDLPIRFVGFGEGVDDLSAFEAEMFVEALFE